jgi:hypothetical protein
MNSVWRPFACNSLRHGGRAINPAVVEKSSHLPVAGRKPPVAAAVGSQLNATRPSVPGVPQELFRCLSVTFLDMNMTME